MTEPLSSLTLDMVHEMLERCDRIVRPWRALIGQCKIIPSPWAPGDQIFVIDMEHASRGVDLGFPPLRVKLSDREPRFMVIGKPDSLAAIEKAYGAHGIRLSEVPAAVVHFVQNSDRCARCKGHGRLEFIHDADGAIKTSGPVKCFACDGRGRIIRDIKTPEIVGANDFEERAAHLLPGAKLPSLDQMKRECAALGIVVDESRSVLFGAYTELTDREISGPESFIGSVFKGSTHGRTEMPTVPEAPCCWLDHPGGCVCGRSERALRAWAASAPNLPMMSADQRRWCIEQIAGVPERARADRPEDWSDVDLAREVLNAWRDYCRDKGLL